MPSKREKIAVGEYYHVYNRGTDKRPIFGNEEDLERFIESMYIFNSIEPTMSLIRKKSELNLSVGVQPLHEQLVEIVAYSLLPNHFHILIKQITEGGTSEFMKRLQGGYTSYFNTEHGRSGALFQGKYKYKHVPSDEYFRTIFCYVTFNANVHNIPKDKSNLVASSFDEYLSRTPAIISKSQMYSVFDVFNNNIRKIKKYGLEVTSIIREKRSKGDYKENKALFE
jgi:putative transposase